MKASPCDSSRCKIAVEGKLPRSIGIDKRFVALAAREFAGKAARLACESFKEVVIVLQDDEFSSVTHTAINGVDGATDVTTQRYDAMPGEEPGVYGELYVNAERALCACNRRRGWSPAKELLLYIAHGMDHLAGSDDQTESDYLRMRRRELLWLRSVFA